ncbi:hypothetical protein JF546_02375 [Nitratireductor aquimarinus]|uniref:hypothetical protein n=1 Tax=Nitratireductor aquimarinus TaxID=889300 RepID=UPI001A8D5DFC|nr:hypothetical protein [Nitratireductor aquimarinus]MBN8241854.1 hypothetical protein [Nitratireductor aquimarinus]MBY6130240.1 hypothetical protein [Nitratireductor aquimarinus]MCA1305131.1 hypothetical protein [Nitratireductor aquimarinus]
MFISFSPQRRDDALEVVKQGDIITINGEAFDLSVVPDGATLPQEAISSDWFAGPVERIGGELHVTLLLPNGSNPSQAVAFPQPITVNEDGPIELPSDDLEETGE